MVITYRKRYTGIPWYTHNMCHCTTKIPLPNCAKGKDADRARPGRGSLEYPTWQRDHLEAFGFETSITYQKICPALRHVRENGRTGPKVRTSMRQIHVLCWGAWEKGTSRYWQLNEFINKLSCFIRMVWHIPPENLQTIPFWARKRLDFVRSAKNGSWCERKSCCLAAI
jgi:hypothetical protein